jgi:hypothetical protein
VSADYHSDYARTDDVNDRFIEPFDDRSKWSQGVIGLIETPKDRAKGATVVHKGTRT